MTPIIAGRFEQEAQADRAADALRQQGFAAEDVTVFYLNPPGQHATFPVGGDRDKSHGATLRTTARSKARRLAASSDSASAWRPRR